MNELKPCPFCGGEATIYDTGSNYQKIYYKIFCKNYCCMQVKLYETPREAIGAWNRRVEK